jgi:hypothetical protein
MTLEKEPEIIETKRLVPKHEPAPPPSCPYPWRALSHGEKITKETAAYQKGTPFHRCGICQYRDGQTCEIVAGYISVYQSCKFFQKKWSADDAISVSVRR